MPSAELQEAPPQEEVPDFRGQKVEGLEAGKDSPESIQFQGEEYLRFSEVLGGTLYSRRVKVDHPTRDEFLIIGPDGIIVENLSHDQGQEIAKRIKKDTER